MQITSFQLSNYKSFSEPVKVELCHGMNVITGQNNAGKTAFLEALSFRFSGNGHRSLTTVPTVGSAYNQTTRIEVCFRITDQELHELLFIFGQNEIFIAEPRHVTDFSTEIGYGQGDRDGVQNLMRWFLSQPSHDFQLVFEQPGRPGPWGAVRIPTFGGYEAAQPGPDVVFDGVQLEHRQHGLEYRFTRRRSGNATEEIGVMLGPHLIERIYTFRAERLNIGASPFGATHQLAPDARNLAEVLNILQQNQARFDRFNECVRDILPHVRRVAVRPSTRQTNSVEIVMWPHDPASERADLAIPLADCGTGIGQVLAILYVVLNSDIPQVVAIDEPQSFLHPGAARKLIEILRRNPQHQYLISTHSPGIITAAHPQQVLMVKLKDGESFIEAMDARAETTQRACLLEVGASLSDVFGADNILWVEGATEEACFPLILERLAGRPLRGTAVKGVVATGDFEGRGRRRRHAELVLEIYERLSKSGSSLIPPAVGFIFDAEGRSEQEKADLEKRSQGRLRFTPRRMYENYLLNAAAITAVVTRELESESLTEDFVQQKLCSLMVDEEYYDSMPADPAERRMGVDGASLLAELFNVLSDGKLEYRKTTHSVALTQWLIEETPDELADIKTLLLSALETRG